MAQFAIVQTKEEKRCTKCHRVRPYSAFSRNATRPDGYAVWCKECDSARNRAARKSAEATNREVRRLKTQVVDGEAFCSRSNHWKPVAEFGSNKSRTSGLQSWCKACQKAYDQEHARWRKTMTTPTTAATTMVDPPKAAPAPTVKVEAHERTLVTPRQLLAARVAPAPAPDLVDRLLQAQLTMVDAHTATTDVDLRIVIRRAIDAYTDMLTALVAARPEA